MSTYAAAEFDIPSSVLIRVNGNDVAGTEACVTGDFAWIFYEGPDSPDGKIIEGVAAARAAVVARGRSLKNGIRFTESERFPSGDKIFSTYRAQGEFIDAGPFDVRAVDIYSFRDGKLARKDTYWKKITG